MLLGGGAFVLFAGGLAAFDLRVAFDFGEGFASGAAVSAATVRGFAAARFLPPRALLASNRATACSSWRQAGSLTLVAIGNGPSA